MTISKFNVSVPKFNFKAGDDFEYKSLKDLFLTNGGKEIYRIRALYINTKSVYGESPVAVCDNFYVNLPNHLLNVVKEIQADEKLVEDINNGISGFTIYEYHPKAYNRTCYSVNWIDL